MGNPEWAETELFSTFISRATNHDAVEASLIDWLSNVPRQEGVGSSRRRILCRAFR